MNNHHKNIFNEDIIVPEIVQSKAEEAFLQIKEKGTDNMKENKIITLEGNTRKRRKIFKPLIAAGTCAALVIAAGNFNFFGLLKENNTAESYLSTSNSEDLGQVISNMFTLQVYAADSPDASENGYVTLEAGKGFVINENELGSVLCESENGTISYCLGTRFLCEGDNIDSITYSIENAAFQIVEPKNSSIITDYEEYGESLNTGTIGGEESESGEEFLSVRRLYKTYTVDYDNQSNEHTWINICNETDLPGDILYNKEQALESKVNDIEQMVQNEITKEEDSLENRVNAIEEMMKDVVITCTVHYKDGTSGDAKITIGGAIITPQVTGIPEKDKPYAGFEFRLEQ